MIFRLRALALSVALFLPAPVAAACSVNQIAELPVTMEDMQPITDAKINGTDVRFMIDSGAFFSVITPGSARALNLHVEPLPGWVMRGINGDTSMSLTTVKTFTLLRTEIPRVQFVVGGSELSGVGVLGQNLLGLGDVEYDLPHGAVRLLKSKGCEKTNMAYWAGSRPYSLLEIAPRDPNDPQTVGTVLLNGVKIKATFDTGANDSILSMAAAARAGITPKSPGVKPGGIVVGFGRKLVRTWIAPFDSFKVGDQEEIRHGRIRFGETTSDTDLLLGADFFIAHRVYVANRDRRLFLTYEGGPVFNLKTVHRDPSGVKLVDAAPADSPTTAEGYSRAGAVRLAQHDREGALADFTKAIGLAPAEPRYLLQRADVYLAMDRKPAAVADVDKAVALKPGDVAARLMRVRLGLSDDGWGDPAMAADLDAVDHAAALAADERLELGSLYTDIGLPARGVPQYDLWLRYHSEDVRRPEAFNGRCWARALAGVDLQAALSDCNSALRQRAGNLSILDSKAMVELRMGDLDKAIRDYDAVLAKTPKSAWSLYGRGVAKRRKGDAAGGKADIDAALALTPHLAERAKRLGIDS
jgi:tetratricopeptide (TPR) repeat protein